MGFQQLMPRSTFIFECSTATYLDCVQKGLFGSNLPWPLQIKKGDHSPALEGADITCSNGNSTAFQSGSEWRYYRPKKPCRC